MANKTKQLSKSQYLQVVGLFALAERYYKKTEECRKALEELTGDGDFGHVADAIYGDQGDADSVLRKMGITVRK